MSLNVTGPPPELPQQSLDLSTYPTTGLQQFGLFIIIFFPAVSVLLVSLRVYDRFSTRCFGLDDGFIVLATLLAAVEAVFSYAMMKMMYLGIHVWDIPPPGTYDPTLGKILNYIVVMLYNPELALVKSSVLFFLLRLGGHQLYLRRSIQILNWSNIALTLAILFASIFTCVPVHKYWTADVPGRCNDEQAQYLVTSGLTVLTDVLVLIIPIKIVIGLQVARKMKIILICVLCAGIVVTVFSILRMAMLYKLYNPDPFIPGVSDPTYNIGFVYSTVECNLAIITATIPPLHGLLRRWFPRVFQLSTTKSSGCNRSSVFKGNGYTGGSRGGALQTIGGSGGGVALKDLKSPKGSAHTRLNSLTNSEEEILGKDRIITRTTSVHISYESGGEITKGEKNGQVQQYGLRY
ncbi:hypothetical protein V8F33_007391 [Rhypophila sp. PSN 637]